MPEALPQGRPSRPEDSTALRPPRAQKHGRMPEALPQGRPSRPEDSIAAPSAHPKARQDAGGSAGGAAKPPRGLNREAGCLANDTNKRKPGVSPAHAGFSYPVIGFCSNPKSKWARLLSVPAFHSMEA